MGKNGTRLKNTCQVNVLNMFHCSYLNLFSISSTDLSACPITLHEFRSIQLTLFHRSVQMKLKLCLFSALFLIMCLCYPGCDILWRKLCQQSDHGKCPLAPGSGHLRPAAGWHVASVWDRLWAWALQLFAHCTHQGKNTDSQGHVLLHNRTNTTKNSGCRFSHNENVC